MIMTIAKISGYELDRVADDLPNAPPSSFRSSSKADFGLLCPDARTWHVSLQSAPSHISHNVTSRIR